MNTPNPKHAADSNNKKEQEVLSALRGMSYGSVQIIIHNREIVEIVRTERRHIGAQQAEKQ